MVLATTFLFLLPLLLIALVLLGLRRWTQLPALGRSIVAIISGPGIILLLYSQAGSNGDADERAALSFILCGYVMVGAALVGSLELFLRDRT